MPIDVAGHPEGEPTLADLEQLNTDLTEDDVREHLSRLVEEGIVKAVGES